MTRDQIDLLCTDIRCGLSDPCGGVLPAVEGRPRSSAHTRIVTLGKLGLLRVIFLCFTIYKLIFLLVCRGGVGEGTKYPNLNGLSSFLKFSTVEEN